MAPPIARTRLDAEWLWTWAQFEVMTSVLESAHPQNPRMGGMPSRPSHFLRKQMRDALLAAWPVATVALAERESDGREKIRAVLSAWGSLTDSQKKNSPTQIKELAQRYMDAKATQLKASLADAERQRQARILMAKQQLEKTQQATAAVLRQAAKDAASAAEEAEKLAALEAASKAVMDG